MPCGIVVGRSVGPLTLSNLEIVLFLKALSSAPRLGAMLSAAISVAATAIADTARRILVQMLTSVRFPGVEAAAELAYFLTERLTA